MRCMASSKPSCSHLLEIDAVKEPRAQQCDECVKTGDKWVHLRTCQACGATLCCDSSVNKHASRHAKSAGHPVVASAEPGERWMWCYPDEAFLRY